MLNKYYQVETNAKPYNKSHWLKQKTFNIQYYVGVPQKKSISQSVTAAAESAYT